MVYSSIDEDFPRYQIQSDLLNICIEGGELNNIRFPSITGFTDYEYSRYLLTIIVKYAFNFQRRPGYEETFFVGSNADEMVTSEFKEIMSCIHSIPDQMLDEAIKDIQALYKHTQDMIVKYELIDEYGNMEIYRALNEVELAQMIFPINEGALEKSNFTFEIETNVLLSAEFNDNAYYHKPLKVELRLPAENILIHPHFILTSFAQKSRYPNSFIFENELIIFNRHPKGKITFQSNQICSKNLEVLEKNIAAIVKNYDVYQRLLERRFLYEYECESFFTENAKIIILHNHIEKMLDKLTLRLRNKVIKTIEKL